LFQPFAVPKLITPSFAFLIASVMIFVFILFGFK
jgi:hypothetical protein